MDQVFEILCHRERTNSVLLLGVGKTATARRPAHRIGFEPDRVPVHLGDCQIVNLQMNAMVAGTMSRGMFEDRHRKSVLAGGDVPHRRRHHAERIQGVHAGGRAAGTALGGGSAPPMPHLQLPDKVTGWLDTAEVRAETIRRFRAPAGNALETVRDGTKNHPVTLGIADNSTNALLADGGGVPADVCLESEKDDADAADSDTDVASQSRFA